MLDLHIKFHYFDSLKRFTLATEKNTSEIFAIESSILNDEAREIDMQLIGSSPIEELISTDNTTSKTAKKLADKVSKPGKKVVVKKQAIVTSKNKSDEKKSIKDVDAIDKPKKVTSKKIIAKQTAFVQQNTAITFRLKYATSFGQTVYLSGNHDVLGNGKVEQAVQMQYLNDEYWSITLHFSEISTPFSYNYFVKNTDGTLVFDWGNDKTIEQHYHQNSILVLDSWNYAGYFENAFYTEPFQNVLLPTFESKKAKSIDHATHVLKVKAPLLSTSQAICVVGSCNELKNWNTSSPIVLSKEKDSVYYSVELNLSAIDKTIEYKFGVYDITAKSFVRFEEGSNRILAISEEKFAKTIVNNAFAILPNNTWKGTGIAIPVFSLRSEKSFGVGEFSDIISLVDWCKMVGMKMVQILPVNDTTATHTNADSYPYAAISAFALHPIYLNLSKVVSAANKKIVTALEKERKRLNELATVDYATVMKLKNDCIKKIFPLQQAVTFESVDYKEYFESNKHWLIPYACFCYLRDEYGTADYNQWPAYKNFNQQDIDVLTATNSKAYNDIAIHYFIQYHLHLQLKEAAEYAHKNSIILKGDIAIGIYRYGTDAWQSPELYNMHVQAGAPPDDFAVKGQNWGFPTYNWQKMKDDDFTWWKQRFEQMSYYFDAFRIDHILGFFRIWSIPIDAVEGIMGHFVPAIPIHINEFNEKGVWFDYNRYTKPFINDGVIWEVFAQHHDYIKNYFLNYDGYGNYSLKQEFNTQQKVEQYFSTQEKNEFNTLIKQGLFDLISNVILFEHEYSNEQQFHFRFGIEATTSFKYLDHQTQHQLKNLYIDYFFKRQDDFWMQEALQKLPALKRTTNMLICGEDLGMVPACVPDVMKQLGLLSLEIQRMPKDPKKQFFHPNDAPYLSVVTPSTHDMSTIRGWWEEDRTTTQQFYNNELGQWGDAPFYCEAWINKAIVIQHLYSPAMWSVFQLQDILGIDDEMRRTNPHDERINVPANPKHFWCYRMHLSLEALQESDRFNSELKKQIKLSGR